MQRRDFIVGLGIAVSLPMTARAQHSTKKVGFLSVSSPNLHAPFVTAFHEGLRKEGYIQNQNLTIEYAWAEGRFDRLPALAAGLIGHKVDVVVSASGERSTRAAVAASSSTPVVFVSGRDPVQTGTVASFARPGGNVTGISMISTQLMAKRVELLSELATKMKDVALLANPDNHTSAEGMIPSVQKATSERGMRLHVLNATREDEFEPAFVSLAALRVEGLIVGTDPFFTSHRHQIVALAARYKIPAIYEWQEFVSAGGLVSYGPSLTDVYRDVGVYAGKVLNGVKPADLPVLQPTKFLLAINLKAAKALGIVVAPSLLARADEVLD
jgi:ABC-type uncharacterized transport system substrate-binding protein